MKMRQFKFRCWNAHGSEMVDWNTLVKLSKIHLLANNQPSYHIMQWSGLKDKKGVDIYEGDTIDWLDYQWLIVYDNSDASFFAESVEGCGYESGQEWGGNCVVVGNIYQNKDLLNE